MKFGALECRASSDARAGLTLMELLLASAASMMVMGLMVTIFVGMSGTLQRTTQRVELDQEANHILNQMVYGVGEEQGLRAGATVWINGNDQAWQLNYALHDEHPRTNSFAWSQTNRQLIFNPGAIVVGQNIEYAPKPYYAAGMVAVTMRLSRVAGRFTEQREIQTAITLRNN